MNYLILAFLFTSVSVFACPDLSGQWASCRSKNGVLNNTSDFIMTQKSVNGVTVYQQTGVLDDNVQFESELFADGVRRTESHVDAETGEVVSKTTTLACKGNTLMSEVILSSPSETIKMKGSTYKSGNTLVTSGLFTSGDKMYSDTLICE